VFGEHLHPVLRPSDDVDAVTGKHDAEPHRLQLRRAIRT
jgi:hypothetical protein